MNNITSTTKIPKRPKLWSEDYENLLIWTLNEPTCRHKFQALQNIITFKGTSDLVFPKNSQSRRYAQIRRSSFRGQDRELPESYDPYSFINPFNTTDLPPSTPTPPTSSPIKMSPMKSSAVVPFASPGAHPFAVDHDRVGKKTIKKYNAHWGFRGNINHMQFIHVNGMLTDMRTHTVDACIVLIPSNVHDASSIEASFNDDFDGIIIKRPLKHSSIKDHEKVDESFTKVFGNDCGARIKAFTRNNQAGSGIEDSVDMFILPGGLVGNNMNFNKDVLSYGPKELHTRVHFVDEESYTMVGNELKPITTIGAFVSVVIPINDSAVPYTDRKKTKPAANDVVSQLQALKFFSSAPAPFCSGKF
jgi:hypothetical protein